MPAWVMTSALKPSVTACLDTAVDLIWCRGRQITLRADTEDAEGINLTHLSPPVRSWVYIGGLGKVMSKESAPPMLTCLSIHQQLWINRWIMGIVLWRLIHLIILHMLFLPEY